MASIMVGYLRYARGYYGSDKSSEWHRIHYALGPLKELYADLPTEEFGCPGLKAVRQRMIDRDWARTNFNQRVKRIERMIESAAARIRNAVH